MKIFRQRTFDVDELKLGPGTYTDYEFDRCTFSRVPFVFPRLPQDRAVVRNIKLFNCDVRTTMLGSIVAEECIVQSLKTHALFFIYGAVFKHVVLRGRFGSLIFTEFIPEDDEETKGQKALFRRADEAYYEHVDWALDIRDAEFYESEFRYVPGHLVRRDPDTQGLVWRDKLAGHDLKRLYLPASAWHLSLQMFAESRFPSVVLVAGKRNLKFKRQLKELKELRELGIAEPD